MKHNKGLCIPILGSVTLNYFAIWCSNKKLVAAENCKCERSAKITATNTGHSTNRTNFCQTALATPQADTIQNLENNTTQKNNSTHVTTKTQKITVEHQNKIVHRLSTLKFSEKQKRHPIWPKFSISSIFH